MNFMQRIKKHQDELIAVENTCIILGIVLILILVKVYANG